MYIDAVAVLEGIPLDVVNLGLITSKIILGFISLYFILIVTGRTSITQLTPYHFVFLMLLDDLLGHIIYEKNQSIYEFLYAAILWTIIMMLLEVITRRYTKIRVIIQGTPLVIIKNGILDRSAIKKAKLDINQVLSLLRQKSVFSVREVEFAILEPNGQLSVALKSKYENPKMEDFNFPERKVELPITLIMDGKIIWDHLFANGLNEKWLINELNEKGFDDVRCIFHAEWKENGGLHLSPK